MLNLLRVILLAALAWSAGAAMARCQAHAASGVPPRVLKVVVIDTGAGSTTQTCTTPPPDDVPYHGTNIVGIIEKTAGPSTLYCIEVRKVYFNGVFNLQAYLEVLSTDADIVHLSLSGTGYLREEVRLMRLLLDRGVLIVAAAGNDSLNLDNGCNVYPACADPRIVVIGNGGSQTSNYGKPVDAYLNGQKVTGGGLTMSGSSQSAALFTGAVIKKYIEKVSQKHE